MKKTMRFLSTAALALVGAVMTGCSSDDSLTGKAQEPAVKNNVVTLTTTVNLGGDGTRALTIDGNKGVKTFGEGDKIAVIYKDTDSKTKKVESVALTADDITGEGKSATFTVTLTAPEASSAVRYIYPAAMAAATVAANTAVNADATINYAALASQDGTLTTLASKYDLAVFDGSLTADATLPASSTLTNRLAIVAYTIKDNAATPNDLTNTITRLTVSDGPNTYGVTRTAADGPVYIAIRPTSGATISIMATTGTTTYTKSLASKTYAANNIYKAGLKMTEVPGAIPGMFSTSSSGGKVYFSKGNLQATYNGSTWTWAFAANQWDHIGDAAKTSTGNGNTSISGNGTLSANGTVDLFGWSTDATTYGIHNSVEYSTYSGSFVDWGATMGTGWRTLSKDEWVYVFGTNDGDKRSGATVGGTSNARYTEATINTNSTSVNGVILFPDGATFAASEASWGTINSGSAWGTKCTTAQWTALEAAGCVFLPAARNRDGSSVGNTSTYGFYWSSTSGSADNAYDVYFRSGSVDPADYSKRYYGCSVRLVREVPAGSQGTVANDRSYGDRSDLDTW